MDDFERELTRMMHDSQHDTPFAPDDRTRLRAGVHRYRRNRLAGIAAVSVLTAAVAGAGGLTLSDAFAAKGPAVPGAVPAASTVSVRPGLLDALRRDIPSSYGRVEASTPAGAFLLTSPQGTRTYLSVMVRTFNDPRMKPNRDCAQSHAKDGGGMKTLGCTQLDIPGGSGWELAWSPAPGLAGNDVEYTAPYQGGWVSVDVENCNALHSCSTGSGPSTPPMVPTAPQPPLGMALLNRIAFDPDVVGTAGRPALPLTGGRPGERPTAGPGGTAPTPAPGAPSSTASPSFTPTAGPTASLPPVPTGAAREAVLAAIRDVDARLTYNENQAITAAREQCAVLASGVADPAAAAARTFSYGGVTLTPADGVHIDDGLRRTLCP